jgi:hypothetical protein
MKLKLNRGGAYEMIAWNTDLLLKELALKIEHKRRDAVIDLAVQQRLL